MEPHEHAHTLRPRCPGGDPLQVAGQSRPCGYRLGARDADQGGKASTFSELTKYPPGRCALFVEGAVAAHRFVCAYAATAIRGESRPSSCRFSPKERPRLLPPPSPDKDIVCDHTFRSVWSSWFSAQVRSRLRRARPTRSGRHRNRSERAPTSH